MPEPIVERGIAAGRRLGPYVLEALLGAGGMGEVYRARDSRLGRTVAVKILPPEAATAARLHRFEQEARAASALNHPNILTIHDVGRDGDIAYVAMEWIEGQNLRSVLAASRLPIRRVVELGTQVADGLAKAHAAGIVHRDIKPENVMVSDDGFVKIVDFGLARLTGEAPGSDGTIPGDVTRTSTAVSGTVGYLSPEQASGHPVDHRSDQFALGVLLYEMATGTRPFERATIAQSLAATIEAAPRPVEQVNRDVPPQLATVIARCLDKCPTSRYESSRDLARDLRAVRDAIHTPQGSARSWTRARWPWAAAMLAVGFGLTAVSLVRSTPTPPSAEETPLLAMRPFRNLSGDPAQADLAGGLSDETHAKLSTLGSLQLLNGSAVGRNAGVDNRRLASDYGVDAVLEGTVRVDIQRARVEARLVRASTGAELWSATHDYDRHDALAIPGEVAIATAGALGVRLAADERARVARRPTEKLEAYLHYLRWWRLRAEWTDRDSYYASLNPLRQAISLDPDFALAQAWLAYDLALMGAIFDGEAWSVESLAHAEEALRRDPSLSKAHNAIAAVHFQRGAAAQARLSFQRAIALDPNDLSGMFNLSLLDMTFGRFGSGLEWARRGYPRSGRRGNDRYHVAAPLLRLRDDDETLRWLREAERLYPTHPRVQQEWALLDLLNGRNVDALARARRNIEKGPQDNPESVQALAEIAYLSDAVDLEALTVPLLKESAGVNSLWLGETARVRYAYALLKRGESTAADALLAPAERAATESISAGDETPLRRIELAAIAAFRGRSGLALDWLGRAYDAGFREYGILERDPAFATLRSHARFLTLLDGMRRDVAAQRQAAREAGLLDIDSLLQAGGPGTGPQP